MHLFLVDETNRDFVANHFFIVGGLIFTEAQIEQADAAVVAIRQKYGYERGDSLKFDTNTRPDHVSVEDSKAAKQEVIATLEALGVRMIAYVILHDLCANQSYDVRMNYALNVLVSAYDSLLHDEKSIGSMLIDRDNGRFDHLEYLFQHGLKFQTGSHRQVDGRIKLFGMTNDNASHLSSAADVALGAFRYCVNAAGGWGKDAIARAMFPSLAEIIWGRERGGVKRLGGYGYHAYPKSVRKEEFKLLYNALADGLNKYATVA